MKTLLIYIPTYNRLAKLTFCIERLIEELEGFEDHVVIYVSDNCSTDGTYEFLQGVDHPSLYYSRNHENIGLAKNVLKSHDLAELAEFTWAIGDDDVILSGGISMLLDAIKLYPAADLLFLNTASFSDNNRPELLPQIISNHYRVKDEWGPTKSSIRSDFQCTFKELFDPRIDAVFLGSLMCYAWRSRLVNNRISSTELGQDFSRPKACYHIALNYLYCLSPDTKCSHLHMCFTANFWHGGTDWGDKGLDLAVTQGLGIVLYEAIRLGYVDEYDQASYFAHYMAMASPFYRRFLESPGDGFQDRLVDFHPQLAEMLLRYGVTALYKPQDLWFRLSELSPRKAYAILDNVLRRLRTAIVRGRLGG